MKWGEEGRRVRYREGGCLTLPRSQNIALSEVKSFSKLLLKAGKDALGHKVE